MFSVYSVIVIRDNVLSELVWTGSDREDGIRRFLDTCSINISNFDEYAPDDIESILDDGYEKFGNGSVCFLDHSNSL